MALGDEQPYTAREVAPPETDAAKPGSIQQWLKGLLTLFQGEDADGNPVAAPQVHAQWLEAEASVTASATETTFSGYTDPAGEAYIPTVDLDVSGSDETYLDVRHLDLIEIRAVADADDADITVYSRLTRNDEDKTEASDVTVTSAGYADVTVVSLSGPNYIRIESNETASVAIGGTA